MVYLISYEVLKLIKGDDVLPDWALHLFSATGALTMAFARIIWFDSLEVETYTPGAFFRDPCALLWTTLVQKQGKR